MTSTNTGAPESLALPDMPGLLKIIRRLVGEVHPKWRHIRFSPDTLLERELGLDSLARMELCSRIRDETGIELDEHAAMRATTPFELLCAMQASITGLPPDSVPVVEGLSLIHI